jgi:hypothetical protein
MKKKFEDEFGKGKENFGRGGENREIFGST